MEVCRLCGFEKIADELVMLLTEKCGIITLKENVEFYCRLTLDSDPNLPQNVCQSCKNVIAKFGEFCFQVEELQQTFHKLNNKDELKEENVIGNNAVETKINSGELDDDGSDSLLVEKIIDNSTAEIQNNSNEQDDTESESLLDEIDTECEEEPMELIDSYIEFDPYLFCEPSYPEPCQTVNKSTTTSTKELAGGSKQLCESIARTHTMKSQRKVRDLKSM